MSIFSTIYKRIRNIILYEYYIPVQYYVYPELKLIYIPIPKVACTSIKLALESDNCSKDSENYETYMGIHSNASAKYEKLSIKDLNNYYKIAFVRNPFDRIVSCYEDKVLKPKQHHGLYYFSTGYNNVLLKILYGSKFHEKMSFLEFASLVARIPDTISDVHFRSQYSFLHKNNKIIPGYIGKFESMTEDWDSITHDFNVGELPVKNKSQRNTWQNYYVSREIIDLIAKRYNKDIQAFGYQDEYDSLISRLPSKK